MSDGLDLDDRDISDLFALYVRTDNDRMRPYVLAEEI